jgi:RNA recognition motif-containing protein
VRKEEMVAKNKLYVGNMSYATSEDELRELFAAYGQVASVNIVLDRDTGRPRGFGFVEMGTPEEADAAIQALNEREFGGRKLTVNFARERRKF